MAHIEQRKLTLGKTSCKAQVGFMVDRKRKKKSARFHRKSNALF